MYTPAAAYPEGGVEIVNFILRSIVITEKKKLSVFDSRGLDPKKAYKGIRKAYWQNHGYVETKIYDWDLLECGNEVVGPGIIEAKDTTVVIPHGKRFFMDKYLNGVIENI